MTSPTHKIDPRRDLVLERTVDVPPGLVWRAWTEPKHLMPWFCPKPWRTTACEIDLRPGGRFRTVMEGPDGERFDNVGCYLEIVKERKLVWTSALEPGYRPAARKSDAPVDFLFTAIISLEPAGKGTKYTAVAIHQTETDAKTHNEMGFQDGWGKVLEQLVEYVKTI